MVWFPVFIYDLWERLSFTALIKSVVPMWEDEEYEIGDLQGEEGFERERGRCWWIVRSNLDRVKTFESYER